MAPPTAIPFVAPFIPRVMTLGRGARNEGETTANRQPGGGEEMHIVPHDLQAIFALDEEHFLRDLLYM